MLYTLVQSFTDDCLVFDGFSMERKYNVEVNTGKRNKFKQ